MKIATIVLAFALALAFPAGWAQESSESAVPTFSERDFSVGEGDLALPGTLAMPGGEGPFPAAGGSALVNAMNWDAGTGTYQVSSGPSMRMVVDLDDLDASRWVNQTGNSGHPFHAHFSDQTGPWLAGETFPWPSTEEAVREAAVTELTLRPGSE